MYKDNLKNERLGQVNKNNFGTEMKIVDYETASNIVVEFLDDYHYKVHTCYTSFVSGKTKNPYDKTVYGVGFIGVGKYGGKKDHRKAYKTWSDMIQRCYCPDIEKQYGYLGCNVADEWHNFQNFAKWYYDNMYTIDGENLHLDKDLMFFNNKIYSPDTCLLIPERINYLLIRQSSCRGKYPIGVRKGRNRSRFEARCMTHNGKESIGFFDTPEEAFYAYKKRKEEFIKEIANEYKDKIPDKVYQALLKYEVIDDTKLI
jgi:hypothetical protein